MSFQNGIQNPWLKSLLLSKKGRNHFPAISGAEEPFLNHTLGQGVSWQPCSFLGTKEDSGKERDLFSRQPHAHRKRILWCEARWQKGTKYS